MKLGTHPKLRDGLNRWQRFRLKDLDSYRRKKADYARTPEQREVRRDYMRVWREKNREHHNALCRASHHRNKHKHKERNRDWALRRVFGIGLKDKLSMVEAQKGKCKICCRAFKNNRSTQVDHDHTTGRIRGILCLSCNTKLEWYIKYHETIVGYLE